MPDLRDVLPQPPWEGPPMPKGLSQYWPTTAQDILKPPFPLRLHYQREGIRKLDEAIDLYLRHAGELSDEDIAHVDELIRLRDDMVRRLATMRRLRR